MKTTKISALFGTALLGLTAGSVSAATVISSEDAYVKGSGSTGGDSAADNMNLKWVNNDANLTRKGYVQFNTSTLESAFDTASLTFTVKSFSNSGSSGFNLQLWGLNDTGSEGFDETTITSANAPGNSSDDTFNSEMTLLETLNISTNVDEGATLTFSAASLKTFLEADTNDIAVFGLVLNGNANDDQPRLYTKEAVDLADRPTLVTTVIPEPSSIMLGAIGALALLRRRK